MADPHTARWLVLGHYGGHNTGDEAMLSGLVQGCPLELHSRLTLVTRSGSASLPPNLQRIAGLHALPASVGAVAQALPQAHGIILGGGSHFQDDYAADRYPPHLRYMARFVGVSALAYQLGKPVLWLGMGFGPCFRGTTRMITRIGLRFCTHVTVREAASAHEIRGWIAPAKLTQAFDLAALLIDGHDVPPTPAPDTHYLGVSLLSVQRTLTGGATVNQQFWQRTFTALADLLATHPMLRIRIFVIRGGKREDDFALSTQLYRTLIGVDAARVEIIPYLPDPTLTLRKMRECQSMLATRFHAGVLGYLAGCRLGLIVYHRKLTDLANEIGLDRAACLALDADISTAQIREHGHALITGDARFEPHLPRSTAIARSRFNTALIARYS